MLSQSGNFTRPADATKNGAAPDQLPLSHVLLLIESYAISDEVQHKRKGMYGATRTIKQPFHLLFTQTNDIANKSKTLAICVQLLLLLLVHLSKQVVVSEHAKSSKCYTRSKQADCTHVHHKGVVPFMEGDDRT